MYISRRNLLIASGGAPLARLFAQQSGQTITQSDSSTNAEPPAIFSTNVKVVNVFAAVRDKKGQIVRNLVKDDFELQEDGRPQQIRYFSAESNLPLTLGLLVDTSGSQRRVLNDERDASHRFFGQVLREDIDQAFVIHFDFEIELLQELTNSREKLEKALDHLEVGDRPQNGGGGQRRRSSGTGSSGRGRAGGGTTLYDSILLASEDVLEKQMGRKAIVVVTDGVDMGSKTTLFGAIRAAQKSDTIVYSILFADPNGNAGALPRGGFGGPGRRRGGWGGTGGAPGGGMGYPRPREADRPDGKKVLEQISRETGGRFFQVTSKLPIDKVYAEIEEELRNQYSLGYSPDQTTPTSTYRHISLTTKKKDMTVQAREGYFPDNAK